MIFTVSTKCFVLKIQDSYNINIVVMYNMDSMYNMDILRYVHHVQCGQCVQYVKKGFMYDM